MIKTMSEFIKLDAKDEKKVHLLNRLILKRRELELNRLNSLASIGIEEVLRPFLDISNPEHNNFAATLTDRSSNAFRRLSYLNGAIRFTEHLIKKTHWQLGIEQQ